MRTRDEPPAGGQAGGQGRSRGGKLLVAGAIEVNGAKPGRLRLSVLRDDSATSLHAFIKTAIAAGSTAKTDGLSS